MFNIHVHVENKLRIRYCLILAAKILLAIIFVQPLGPLNWIINYMRFFLVERTNRGDLWQSYLFIGLIHVTYCQHTKDINN